MRFIDREELHITFGKLVQESLLEKTFGRNVEQLERTGAKLFVDGLFVFVTQRTVQEGGRNTVALQGLHLVLHQGDQGRDNHSESAHGQCRHLEAEALTATGGHQHHGIVTIDHMLDHFLLERTKGLVAEVAFEKFVQ